MLIGSVDLTGLEPVPATLMGFRAAITPQAHPGDATLSTDRGHGRPSHHRLWIPEMKLFLRRVAHSNPVLA